MKTLIAFFALIVMTMAHPSGYHQIQNDKATEIIHGEPVITHVFHTPGQGVFTNYAPKIDGHLETRGYGPHIYYKKDLHY